MFGYFCTYCGAAQPQPEWDECEAESCDFRPMSQFDRYKEAKEAERNFWRVCKAEVMSEADYDAARIQWAEALAALEQGRAG